MNPLPLVLATLRRDLRVALPIVLLVAFATSLGLIVIPGEYPRRQAVLATIEALMLIASAMVVVCTLAARRPGAGALRALGAPRRFVLAAISLEAAMLVGAGITIGVLLGTLPGLFRS